MDYIFIKLFLNLAAHNFEFVDNTLKKDYNFINFGNFDNYFVAIWNKNTRLFL